MENRKELQFIIDHMSDESINMLLIELRGHNVCTSEKDLRVCEVVASAWISVKERLPENEERIIVYKKNGKIIISTYSNNEFLWWGLDGWIVQTSQITHWRQLPEPPK